MDDRCLDRLAARRYPVARTLQSIVVEEEREMRHTSGAARARVLSEMYREKSGETDSRTNRTARDGFERDGDCDPGTDTGRVHDHADRDGA